MDSEDDGYQIRRSVQPRRGPPIQVKLLKTRQFPQQPNMMQPQPQPQPQPQYVQEPLRQQYTYTQPAQQYAQPQYVQPPQQTVYASPQTVPASASDKTDKVVGTGAYFWLMFLYALPVIGFLVCLIMGFAAKNKNLKHFARAILIWVLVGLILSAIISIAVYFLIGSLGDLAGLDLGSLFDGFGIGGFGG